LIEGLPSPVFFQVPGFFVSGYLDPLFIVAFVVGAFVASDIAFLVGIFQRHLTKDIEVA